MRVLVYVDGSDASMNAVERAVEMASEGSQITVLHVAPPRLDRDLVSQFEFESEDLDANFAGDVLRLAKQRFEEKELDVDIVFDQGPVAETICARADEGPYDLILMGARDRTSVNLLDLSEIVARKSAVRVEVVA